MPLLLKPTDFPSNDEIENASYEDEEITVALPETVGDDGEVVRESTEITRTMCIARFEGDHAIVRRISSNRGGEAEYRRLEDAKLELIACEGKTPKIHSVPDGDPSQLDSPRAPRRESDGRLPEYRARSAWGGHDGRGSRHIRPPG